jgi:hypothetical protein
MSDAERAAALLDESQLRFIQDEFGYDPDALGALSDDDFEKLYDRLGDIEVEETMAAGDGELSDRGKMAESIVTAIGNELYGVED